jgi:predicted transcriptional regulator
MDVILSIKPIYANGILEGRKKVEFRKKIFKKEVDRIYIYSSMPKKMIVGYFTFKKIDEDSPKKLWEKYKEVGGINENDFFEYFKGHRKGFSIIIDNVVRFEKETDPIEFIENFSAPQSYIYLKEKKNCIKTHSTNEK